NTHLALLRARAGDSRATALAGTAASEIARPPAFLTPPWNEATVYHDLGQVYLLLGQLEEAKAWLEKSLQRWRELKAPAALETQRGSELAAVEADLAPCRPKR